MGTQDETLCGCAGFGGQFATDLPRVRHELERYFEGWVEPYVEIHWNDKGPYFAVAYIHLVDLTTEIVDAEEGGIVLVQPKTHIDLLTLRSEVPPAGDVAVQLTHLYPAGHEDTSGLWERLQEKLGEPAQEDDGPGGRRLMPKAAREKHVKGWLFDVKQQGGITRDEYANANFIAPDTFRHWITEYNKEHPRS